MQELQLETRAGLPDALSFLLEEYPRDAWQQDQGFHGLVSFWLDRHVLFRNIVAAMREQTLQVLDRQIDTQHYAGQLSRYARLFVGQLHGHHHIEDSHFFPLLMERESKLKSGFAMLDADHHELDRQLAEFTDAANLIFEPQSDSQRLTAAGQFDGVLARLDNLLDRHLLDEEDLIVPLILKYGSDDLY